MISEKALKDFIEVYRQEFGVELDNETATEMAISLLILFKNIYRPIKKNWLNEYEKKNKE